MSLENDILQQVEKDAEGKLVQQAAAPQVRILQCFVCKTMEEIPDYPPDYDPAKDALLHAVDERHGGATENPHHRALHRVSQELWADSKAKRHIVDSMWKDEKGFTPSYYDVKNTLKEDANKCFDAHRRQVPCIDWKDSSKVIKPPTTSDRKKLARELPRSFGGDRDRIAHGAPVHYLCEFCPVAVAVEHAKRVSRGEA